MSPTDQEGAGQDDDLVAAEYVIGVLPMEERLRAAARLQDDRVFAELVESWQSRLSPLDAAYADEQPPAELKQAIDRKLFSANAADASGVAPRGTLWQSLAFWRGLAAAALAALLLAVVLPPFLGTSRLPGSDTYVASLAPSGSDVRYLAYYDTANGSLALSHVSGAHGAGHDFQLWLIVGHNKPVSLGLVPAGQNARLPVSPRLRNAFVAGTTIAISLEPQGGSPTGQPTGPVVAAGGLNRI